MSLRRLTIARGTNLSIRLFKTDTCLFVMQRAEQMLVNTSFDRYSSLPRLLDSIWIAIWCVEIPVCLDLKHKGFLLVSYSVRNVPANPCMITAPIVNLSLCILENHDIHLKAMVRKHTPSVNASLSHHLVSWIGFIWGGTSGIKTPFKGMVHPKINYSPSRCSKPIRLPFIFGTQIKIFLMESETFHRP